MVVLSLDVATTTGYAILEVEEDQEGAGTTLPTLKEHGAVTTGRRPAEYAPYPWGYIHASRDLATKLGDLVARVQPDAVVIEETNLAKARMSQKLLEFLHNALLTELEKFPAARGYVTPPVFYVSSGVWRREIGLQLSDADRRANARLSKAKSAAKKLGRKLDKTSLGIRGRVKWKHLSVRWANQTYGLGLKLKDDDVADAICLGVAFCHGVQANLEED